MPESRKDPRHAGTPGLPPPAVSVKDTEEIVLTVDKATHEVVKIARLNKAGERRDISQEQAVELAGQDFVKELLHAVDDVYRAGLSEGLATDTDQDDLDDDVLTGLLVGLSPDPDALDLRGALLRPVLLRRLLRAHIGAVPNAQQQRRPPITNRPRNGLTQ
jgi:hypothetical protein